ncbi:TonB-dependent siderophore receptor [Halopseudomonas pelagia]|uniref:TonB-dependent siderophore receptor n=1 Tax=Halopseudomonas pelagia TaxID=553151 RepID=UPI0003A16B7F|nr:TonB-dependent siderophore receptor [Halopseudomonas pelagia]|tara:strand:+ start:602 stop:2773 length:2172 start_codon:yes stop_codon:yes gene_type:complete
MHVKNVFDYHPLALALLLSGLSLSAVHAADSTNAATPSDALVLQEAYIYAEAIENPTGQLSGPVATRSTSASKTDSAIKEIPQSISVITRDEMDNRKTDTLAEALSYTPGVIAQPGGFSRVGDDFVIRGFNVGSGTGGILRDGMKLQGSVYDGGIEPYGLERVEVVKGASSVLYGQLSPGGLINTITKRPTDTPLHEINVEYGSHARKQYSFDLGGPIDEAGQFSYRLTGLWRDSDTQTTDTDDDRRYIAPAFTWRPDEDTSLTFLASYQETRTSFAPPLDYDLTTSSSAAYPKVDRDLFTGERGFDHYNNYSTTIGYLFEHNFTPNLKIRHALRHFEADLSWDYMQVADTGSAALRDQGLLARRASIRRERSEGWTSDNNVQWALNSGRWQHTLLAGVDYYHKTYDSHRFASATSIFNPANPVYGAPTSITSADNGSDLHSAQSGVYLQDQIKFDNKWILLLGGRQDWAESRTYANATGARTPRDDKKATGRVGLVYEADNGLAPYVSWSQSFLPANVFNPNANTSFKPTEGEQYEVGVRYTPPGTNALLSAAVYDLKQKNSLSTDLSGDTVQFGETRSRGVELEAKADVTANLSTTASYAYTDSKITDDSVASRVGTRIDGVPYHMASLRADYRLARMGLPKVVVGGGARFMGTSRTSSSDTDEKVDAYTLFDAKVSYEVDKNWTLAMKAQNLANEKYLFCNASCRYGDERTLIGSVNYRW